MPSPIFVFDAYGTLFDVHAAIARFSSEAGPDGPRMSEIWRTKQLEYTWTLTLSGQYEDFWTLTQRALDFALARMPSVPNTLKPKLLDAYFTLGAFPDARIVLATLKRRGHKTAILTNGTMKMCEAAVNAAQIGRDLDSLLSVEAVKMYKPRPEVYALVTSHFGCAPRDVTLVSSNRWDVMGAMHHGFRGIWVNRGKMPGEYGEADMILNDLSALSDLALH
jgi:2-haloacid dehalogenase